MRWGSKRVRIFMIILSSCWQNICFQLRQVEAARNKDICKFVKSEGGALEHLEQDQVQQKRRIKSSHFKIKMAAFAKAKINLFKIVSQNDQISHLVTIGASPLKGGGHRWMRPIDNEAAFDPAFVIRSRSDVDQTWIRLAMTRVACSQSQWHNCSQYHTAQLTIATYQSLRPVCHSQPWIWLIFAVWPIFKTAKTESQLHSV